MNQAAVTCLDATGFVFGKGSCGTHGNTSCGKNMNHHDCGLFETECQYRFWHDAKFRSEHLHHEDTGPRRAKARRKKGKGRKNPSYQHNPCFAPLAVSPTTFLSILSSFPLLPFPFFLRAFALRGPVSSWWKSEGAVQHNVHFESHPSR